MGNDYEKRAKKEHRKVVSYMRKLNNSIMNDAYLGLGRFRIDMFSENWERYSDDSGGRLFIIFKITDNLTNNSAYFTSDNYAYQRDLGVTANDFLIRCSSGIQGNYPSPNYIAYDIHSVVRYAGDKRDRNLSNEVIATYSYVNGIKF